MAPSTIPTWLTAYEQNTDLKPYGTNSLGLFALALRFNVEDLHSVAAESITDGFDDKKCDMIYINHDEQVGVVAQCYYSQRARPAADASKASDLNTAVSWLLQRPISKLPERLRPAAEGLRDALEEGTITRVEAWFIHNLPESKNVKDELATVEETLKAALDSAG